jgi:hypothetical protein
VVDDVIIQALEALHAAIASPAVFRAGNTSICFRIKFRAVEEATCTVSSSVPQDKAWLETTAFCAATIKSCTIIDLALGGFPFTEPVMSATISIGPIIMAVIRLLLIVFVSGRYGSCA